MGIRHHSKGFGLKPYQRELAKKLSKKIVTGSGRITPEDVQELFAFWDSEGNLNNGDCMCFREYTRSLVDVKFRRSSEWDDYEEGLRTYMGEHYYNKI